METHDTMPKLVETARKYTQLVAAVRQLIETLDREEKIDEADFQIEAVRQLLEGK